MGKHHVIKFNFAAARKPQKHSLKATQASSLAKGGPSSYKRRALEIIDAELWLKDEEKNNT